MSCFSVSGVPSHPVPFRDHPKAPQVQKLKVYIFWSKVHFHACPQAPMLQDAQIWKRLPSLEGPKTNSVSYLYLRGQRIDPPGHGW